MEEANALSKESEDFGLVHITPIIDLEFESGNITFYSDASPSLGLISDLEAKLESEFTNLRLVEKGVDLDVINNSNTQI